MMVINVLWKNVMLKPGNVSVKIETVRLKISVSKAIAIKLPEPVSKHQSPVMMELIVLMIPVIQTLVVYILPTMISVLPMMLVKKELAIPLPVVYMIQ
jgi:hypothetical protein